MMQQGCRSGMLCRLRISSTSCTCSTTREQRRGKAADRADCEWGQDVYVANRVSLRWCACL